MNDAEMLAAMQAGYQTVEVRFLADGWQHQSAQPTFQDKTYNYKVPTAWGVREGDWLIVLPGSAFKTVRVFSVSDMPELLSHNGRPLKWAVQKVDPTFYFNVDTVERQMLAHVRAAQVRKEREALLAEMRNTVGSAVDESMRAFAQLLGGQPLQLNLPTGAGEAAAQAAPATTLNFDASKVAPAGEQGNVGAQAPAASFAATPTAAGTDAQLRAAQEGLNAARAAEGAAAPVVEGMPQGTKPSWAQ
jgi:hypothetical protein